MLSDSMRLAVLISVNDEIEAAVIVDALADHGIRATAVGGHAAGFRAEAPGVVNVVIGQTDLARARGILEDIPQERAEIDWSTVDVGDDQSLVDQPCDCPSGVNVEKQPGSCHSDPHDAVPPLQFSTTTLLTVQAMVCVALAVGKGIGAAAIGAIAMLAGTLVLAAFGTIRIGADLRRARQEWALLVRALALGAAIVALILIISEILSALGITPW